MRIAFVATGGFDESGRERVIPALLWFIERLARRHDVTVYVLRYLKSPRRYPLLGATIQDLGTPDGTRRQYGALAAALRRDGRPDVIHGYWGLPAGLVSTLAATRLGVPSIVTLDSGELVSIPEIGYGLKRLWRQRLCIAATCRMASRVTVCTAYQKRLADTLRADAHVIPFGVDPSGFPPTAARAEGPPWRLVHVASQNRVKNQVLLLQTVRQLIDRGFDLHLDLIGEDTLNGEIPATARTMGLQAHVTFHGHVPSDGLAAFYHRAHVALLTSHHEAAGIVTLEAAACGVPTVGTAVGYVADWSPGAAVAVPSATPEALAGAVARLLSDRSSRERIALAARAFALAHDADWTAAEFERLYQAAAGLRGSSHDVRSRPTID